MAGFVLGAGEGPAYGFHEATVVIKASGQDTLGQLGVMESVHPPGLVVREHVHEGEDEMFYVLEGELNGFCEVSAGPPRRAASCSCRAMADTASR